mmetsp:Transcript_26860/g.79392  ORF Transcript_26860/g.79392 Transcript_26860/m.79392 type:complete len:221 (-) Transcript_26860:82-744(-)
MVWFLLHSRVSACSKQNRPVKVSCLCRLSIVGLFLLCARGASSFSMNKARPPLQLQPPALAGRCGLFEGPENVTGEGGPPKTRTRGMVSAATTLASALLLSLAVLSSPPAAAAADLSLPPPLAQTDAFRSLRRERPVDRAVREINDLRDLQDSRLATCEDKGVFWEQCFMFGLGGEQGTKARSGGGVAENRMDYQLVSPTGALNPTPGTSGGERVRPPTW